MPTNYGGPPWNRQNIYLVIGTVIKLEDDRQVSATLSDRGWDFRELPEGDAVLGALAYETANWTSACIWLNRWEGRIQRPLTPEEKGDLEACPQ